MQREDRRFGRTPAVTLQPPNPRGAPHKRGSALALTLVTPGITAIAETYEQYLERVPR